MTDVSTLLVCLTVLVLWWRLEPKLDSVVSAHVSRVTPQQGEPSPEVPLDIMHGALRWTDTHAQESHVARARELYAESSGAPEVRWDRVRSLLALEADAA